MKIESCVGIISDSHDDRSSISKAVRIFNDAGCSIVIHAGDFIAPFTIREFEKLDADFVGVYGNNDGERLGLKTMFEKIGSLHDPPYEFEQCGKRFIVMHEPYFLEESLARNDLDVIVYGHLHKIDIRSGRPMVINPGESCTWLTGRSTVVLLDLETMSAELVDVE